MGRGEYDRAMRLALAQLNPTIGAIEDNVRLIERAIERAREGGADLLVTPELSVCGYPPKDLLLREGFVARCAAEAKRIGETKTAGIAVLLGCPLAVERGLGNSLLLYRDNELLDSYDKRLLPTYDVFDEDRYFVAGKRAVVHEIAGVRVGLSVCEDLWKGEDVGFADQHARDEDPVAALIDAGAQLIVNPSGSPFVLGKGRRHRELLVRHARRHGVWVASTNQVGGNDELIFDGHACVYDSRGELVAAGPGFEEDVLICEVDPSASKEAHPVGTGTSGEVHDPRLEAPAEELLFRALTLGVRDYVRKTGFERVVLGLSGGIDSAVTAVIATAALGAENVTCLAMPGKYSSEHSVADARELCERIGARFVLVPIEDAFEGARVTIDAGFAEIGERLLGRALPDIAEENLQSRIRGMVVMAHSNRTGELVLTTGNKSELAVGYCTLYGDMNGGLAILSDVLKTRVFGIARWINEHSSEIGAELGFGSPPIPQSTIEKPPSAELAPDQRDSDSLPAYDVLDPIVAGLIEERLSPGSLVARGFDEATVLRIAKLIDRNEYKRKQLATGLKVSEVAFGFGRRMPIALGWV